MQIRGAVRAESGRIDARRRCPLVRFAGFLQLDVDSETPNSDVAWPEVLPQTVPLTGEAGDAPSLTKMVVCRGGLSHVRGLKAAA